MSFILARSAGQRLPTAAGGHGAYLVDADGNEYLDASGGAAISCLGHGHPDIIAAIGRQAASLAFAHTSFFTSHPAEELAERLVSQTPGVSRAIFVSGGSEAVEVALKLARQYFVERGEPGRTHVIARRQSYHGNSLGALAVSGHSRRRAAFEPWLGDWTAFVDPCYPYRFRRPDESLDEYGGRCADELEAAILRLGPSTVAAFIAEPVGGSTAGCLVPPPTYLPRIAQICRRHGVLFIADEVMSGCGRTGTMFGFEPDGVAPDLITLAKGLSGGYQPLGAVLVGRRIAAAIEGGSGILGSGHSFMGHPLACAAALAVQETIEREGLLDNVRIMGDLLMDRLVERLSDHRHVGDIRGRGLFVAVEFVADRDTKAPFAGDVKIAQKIKQAMMRRGLLGYVSSGTADGARGDHVMFAPPYIITAVHVDEIADKAYSAIRAVFDRS